jgi:hypothetical protein
LNIPTHLTATALALLMAAAPSAAQDTRQAKAEQERAEKANAVRPPERGKLEALFQKVEDDLVVERWLNPQNGLFLRLGGIAEGSGFGAGPAFRISSPPVLPRVLFNASGAISLKTYWIAETSLAFPRMAGGHLFAEIYGRRRDFPQEDFFGVGADSLVEDRSNFALRDTTVRGTVGVRPVPWLAIGGTVEHFAPDIGHGTDKLFPSVEERFTAGAVPGLDEQPDFLRYEGFVDIDFRDTIPGLRAASDRLDWPLTGNPRTGGRYTLSFGRYDDRDLGRFTFDQFELDAQQYIPLLKGHRILALRALITMTEADEGQDVPFYLMPTLGGAYTLRGFRTYRFRDRNAMLFQAEYRYHINTFVMGALFYDTGKVTREREDLDFDGLESDYGFGLRIGSAAGVVMRLDIAFGSGEGTRYLLRFNNVF